MGNTFTGSNQTTGAVLAGRYRLGERIADGGMAVVYNATDEVLGRRVAVKVMRSGLASDEAFVERFRREAQSAAGLHHPNVVTVHDWGREEDTVFMVMELVEGESLRSRLERRGRLDLHEVREIVSQIAAALDHLHERGIVHRDVKPENVLLGPGGAKLVDLGVARAAARARLTSEAVVGTMTYIAPEQLSDREVDGRADVFALGVMAYELLVGVPPFDGDTPAEIAAARLAASVPSPGVSPAVDGGIAKATAMRPEDRFATAGEFGRALASPEDARVTVHSHVAVPLPTQVIPVTHDRARRRRWPLALALAVLSAAAGAGAWFALGRTAVVPALAGMSPAGARTALERAGLDAGTRTDVFADADPGIVVGSVPDGSARVRRGTRVTLRVSKGPEMVAVPPVVGRPLDDARAALTAAGLVAGETTEAFSASVAKGSVAEQRPAEGTIKRGAAVALTLSKGPEMVVVPDVAGKPSEDAKAALRSAGLSMSTSGEYSDTVAEGSVMRTLPPAGQHAPKGSAVSAVVSKGPKPFAMPDLVGLDRAAAKEKIVSLGLTVGSEYAVPGSGKPKGQVQGQNPPAGSQVRKGTRIDLYYAV